MSSKAQETDRVEDAQALAIANKLFAAEGTGPNLGIEFVEIGVGYAKLTMEIRRDMLNGMGVAHGGMIFTLADTAFAYACNSRNVTTFAQQASIAFLSKIELGETVTAEAREEVVEGRSGVYSVVVTGQDGRRAAIFQGLSRTAGGSIIDCKEFA